MSGEILKCFLLVTCPSYFKNDDFNSLPSGSARLSKELITEILVLAMTTAKIEPLFSPKSFAKQLAILLHLILSGPVKCSCCAFW